ncbi:MAG: amidohydrolase family protein, partial [Ignisphaera sp.]
IEHASIVRDDQLSKLKGFRIAIQPHFIISDFWIVDRVGIERARYVYRIKSLLDSDIVLGFSTDAPVEDVNPWKTIYAAVTRGIFEDIELAKYTYSEAIDVVEALHLYTKGSGQLLLRNDIGCLEPGCLADINIVDRDPIGLDLHELKNIRSLKVFVGGKAVFL